MKGLLDRVAFGLAILNRARKAHEKPISKEGEELLDSRMSAKSLEVGARWQGGDQQPGSVAGVE